MGSKTARVLLFGDCTLEPVSAIRRLAQDAKRLPALRTFLSLSASALRSELSKSTSQSRKVFPTFATIVDLAEWHADSPVPQIAVIQVLLATAQLGLLVQRAETDQTILSEDESKQLCCIGLCNGLLAASAAAVCKTSQDLLEVGPRILALTLRLAFATVDRSRLIDQSEEPWAYVTPGTLAKDHEIWINEFLSAQPDLPATRRPYVSAEADTASTVSGPPSTLKAYFESNPALNKAKKLPQPINAAFHASHIQVADIDAIVNDGKPWTSYVLNKSVKIYSMDTGNVMQPDSLAELLTQSVDEILNKRFRWNAALETLTADLKESSSHATIIPIGPSRVNNAVERRLADAGLETFQADTELAVPPTTIPGSEDIAIVGVSTRMPGAEDLDQAWQLLLDGIDAHRRIPKNRFDPDTHCDPTGKSSNTTASPFGCFIERPEVFDARMFNMSPREAKQTDPMQRLALLACYEALEQAGYSPNASPSFTQERIATYLGQTLDDYRESNAAQDVDMYYVTGGIRAFGPGRMNYHFKWDGPSMSIDAACSSSALAVHLAFQALQAGECDMAVAGGANIITGSDMFSGLSKGGFLSKTGPCKTFDDGADGYCRGEGVGVVVLKRATDAIAEGDNILAVIKSVSTNHSAHATSITRPETGAQIKLMHKILKDAGVGPDAVDYVEMHGTGTQAGDAAEFSSVSQLFGNKRDAEYPLHIGAIKANIGHGEAAAGISSIVKAMLMLKHRSIPPHVGIKQKLNSKFAKFDSIIINKDLQPFPRADVEDHKLKIVVNSFNAAGGNTALLLEEAPAPAAPTGVDPRASQLVVVSGHTQKAFEGNRRNLLNYLRKNPEARLQDLAYTTTARRMHHDIRAAYVATDLTKLTDLLASDVDKSAAAQASGQSKLVWVFTGQGSQYAGMARQLYETSATFKAKLASLDNICLQQGMPSFLEVVHAESLEPFSQAQVQLALVAVQIALAATFRTWGLTPAAVMGHSIGEYAAMTVAGVLSETDALYLIGKRALAVEETCTPGVQGMLAVAADLATIEKYLAEPEFRKCQISCYNSPTSFVVSGTVESLGALGAKLKEAGQTAKQVAVQYAFHSPQMRGVEQALRKASAGVSFNKPQIPLASTVLGQIIDREGIINQDYLVSHTLDPVNFIGALNELNVSTSPKEKPLYLEIGAHPACGPMVVGTLGVPSDTVTYTLRRNEDAWSSISKTLAKVYKSGVKLDWHVFHQDYRQSLTMLELPAYAFDLENYWIQYEGDWKLSKGKVVGSKPAPTAAPAVPIIDAKLAPLHYLQSQQVSADEVKLQFAVDLSQPEIRGKILGHLVEKVGLCPTSVYSELALHAAGHVVKKALPSGAYPAVDLKDVDIISPLKVYPDREDAPLLSITAQWSAQAPKLVKVAFATTSDHCKCTIALSDKTEWQSEWKESEYLMQSRINHLQSPGAPGVQTLLSSMIYRLFTQVVDYGKPYQVCERMNIDYNGNEATAQMVVPKDTKWEYSSPGTFCLDAIMHMAGFVLNTNPTVATDLCFIANGWTNLRLAEAWVPGKTYTCYTRMVPNEQGSVFEGNVSVFAEGRIIAVCRGLKFHRLKRISLQKLLGAPTAQKAVKSAQPAAPTQQQHAPKQETAAAPKKAQPNTQQVLDEIMSDIAAEIGTSVSDLTDDRKLSDLGVDSLLSLSLLEKLKDKTGLSLPANTFTEYETVQALKALLSKELSGILASGSTEAEVPLPTREESSNNEVAAPQGASNDGSDKPKSEILCEIIANEVGISISDVQAASTISELGVDSLLTMSILQEYKTTAGEDLGATFFNDYPTVEGIIQKIDGGAKRGSVVAKPAPAAPAPEVAQSQPQRKVTHEPSAGLSGSADKKSAHLARLRQRKCISMLLQGDASSKKPALFFLPDGSGSLFSYVHIPKFAQDFAVYGLDSPFHRDPEEFKISFEDVAAIYIREIRKIQPKGPYQVAGWSLGGVHAFEVVRQLLVEGETVNNLLMVDSPCPGTLPPLPSASLDLLEKAGVFEGLRKEAGAVAQHTRLHFINIVNAYQKYAYRNLTPDEAKRLGKVTAIWAKQGVLEHDPEAQKAWVIPGGGAMDADMLKAKEWLTGTRTSFGPCGWDDLTGKEVQCYKMPGNHFNIMFPPLVAGLSTILKEVF